MTILNERHRLMIVEEFSKVLSVDQIITGEDVGERYEHIWTMDVPLKALAVLLPKSAEQLSAILKICHDHDQPIVIHGGLTNLTGATETRPDEVVIALDRMNKIIEIDPQSRTMTVESGVILEQIHLATEPKGLLFPLNFGAKGSAQIGGIIATNAGGLRVIRYGMTRNLILGLEVVLADGTILSSLKKIIKDNSGYDLKHLFIGSEGTLGIITKAVLKLSETPKSRVSAFVGIKRYEDVMSLLKFMDAGLAGTLTGFELMWRDCYQAMTSPPSMMKAPLSGDYTYYVLIDCLGSIQAYDEERMTNLLSEALEEGFIEDAALACTQADLHWFWTIREDVGVFVTQHAFSQHFDISLPIPLIGELIDKISEELRQLEGVEAVYNFGHVGDGNIHIIAGKSTDAPSLKQRINDIVYAPLQAIGGSVSAEHGIGLHKKAYLPISRTANEIAVMTSIKRCLDPKNLLNRNKILDA